MKPENISYFEHEAEVARCESHSRKMFVMWVVTFAALLITNIGWIIYESQFEDISTTVTQEASSEGGDATINGYRAGAVIYGESEADSYNESP